GGHAAEKITIRRPGFRRSHGIHGLQVKSLASRACLDGSETRPYMAGPRASGGSIDQPAGDLGVAVDTAVAQEGPVAAGVFNRGQVDFTDQNLFLVVRSFGDHPAERIAKERASPEFQTISP